MGVQIINPFLGAGGGGGGDPDLALWLAAWKETGYSDGDRITTLVDWSGNGRDFTAPNSGARPRFDANVLNSQPGFWFGGNSDQNYANRDVFFSGSQSVEAMFVIKKPASENGNGAWKFDGGNWASHFTYGGTIYDAFCSQDRDAYTPTYSELTAGVIYQVSIANGTNNHKVWQNGNNNKITRTSTVNHSHGTTPKVQVGASSDQNNGSSQTNWFHGHILELKIWSKVLSNSERNTELAALNSRYGISVTNF